MTHHPAFREDRSGGTAIADPSRPPSDQFDLLADLRKELEQLSAVNREILGELRSHSNPEINLDALAAAKSEPLPPPPSPPSTPRVETTAEVVFLARENAELRERLAELERRLRAAPSHEDAWAERQREYEALLDEKSEVIRTLHLRIQELQEGPAPAASPAAAPQEIHDAAIERMKQELEDQRRQLEEDEANLMQQMRDMEMALAKDRAELARQRAEVQRLQADWQHELEQASRDPQLHERLMNLQRRHQEGGSRGHSRFDLARPATPAPEPPKKSSGLFRRLFSG